MARNDLHQGKHLESKLATFNERPDPAVDPIGALQDLAVRLNEHNAPFVAELEEILNASEGVELADRDAFKEFRDVFSRVSKRLDVGPLLPSGRRGSLQVLGRKNGKAWATIQARGESRSDRTPANTIPPIDIG